MRTASKRGSSSPPEVMITGGRDEEPINSNSASTACPLSFPRCQSSNTRSGHAERIANLALCAVAACDTSKKSSSARQTTEATSRSSSTSNTRSFGVTPAFAMFTPTISCAEQATWMQPFLRFLKN